MALDNIKLFENINDTKHVESFLSSLNKQILSTWSEFEKGILLTKLTVLQLSPYPPSGGIPATVNASITPGDLVSTKPFNTVDEILEGEIPTEFGSWTEYTTHFIKAINLSFLLTMLDWSRNYKLANKQISIGTSPSYVLQVPPNPGVPGFLNNPIPDNTLYLGDGNSIDIKQKIEENIIKFVMNVNLFKTKTDFLLNFISRISESISEGMNIWMNNTYFDGGICVGVVLPGPAALAGFFSGKRPTCVAFTLK